MSKLKVTWSYSKEYGKEEFEQEFSEGFDLVKTGYFEIAADYKRADSMDDLNLEYTIEDAV